MLDHAHIRFWKRLVVRATTVGTVATGEPARYSISVTFALRVNLMRQTEKGVGDQALSSILSLINKSSHPKTIQETSLSRSGRDK